MLFLSIILYLHLIQSLNNILHSCLLLPSSDFSHSIWARFQYSSIVKYSWTQGFCLLSFHPLHGGSIKDFGFKYDPCSQDRNFYKYFNAFLNPKLFIQLQNFYLHTGRCTSLLKQNIPRNKVLIPHSFPKLSLH